jgi:anti-sigma regulatory factor (Ser/Thr protein kinase)
MQLLVLADELSEQIVEVLSHVAPADWQWHEVDCTKHASLLMSVVPVDAVIAEAACLSSLPFAELQSQSLTQPVILVGNELEFSLQQMIRHGRLTSLDPADLEQLLVSVIEDEVTQHALENGGNSIGRRLTLVLDNDKSRISNVVQLLLDVCQTLGVCEEADRFRIGIALEEALVNAVVHGNLEVSSELRERGDDSYEDLIRTRQLAPYFARRRVRLTCEVTAPEVRFIVRDEGPGFKVDQIPDPTDPAYLDRPCGRGLLLMRSFMSEVRYNETGNEVTLVRRTACRLPCTEAEPSLVGEQGS